MQTLLIIATLISSIFGIHRQASVHDFSNDIGQLQKQIDDQGVKLGNFSPTGGITYRLANSITPTASSLNLASFSEPVSGTKYTMTNLNSTVGYATIEPRNPLRTEFVSFTGITQNTDGSATLTGVVRGLPRSNASAGCTASTSLELAHASQVEFVLSNSPCLLNEYAVKQNNETITGAWTVSTPSAAGQIANKSYVDGVLTGTTTISTDKLIVAGTAGETVSAGQLVYEKTSDGRWYKVIASSLDTITDVLIGVAQSAGSSGVSIGGGVLLRGLDTNQSGLVAGTNYFASTTSGSLGLATTSKAVGKAKSTTSIYVDPNFVESKFAILANTNTFTGTNTFSAGTTTIASTTFTVPSSVYSGGFQTLNSQLLASTSIASAAGSISATALPFRTHLHVVFQAPFVTSGANTKFTLNNDTGNDYAYLMSSTSCAGSGIPQTSQANIQLGNANTQFISVIADIIQIASTTRVISGSAMTGGGPAVSLSYCTFNGIWQATTTVSAAVNQITFTPTAGSYGASTTMYVFGSAF